MTRQAQSSFGANFGIWKQTISDFGVSCSKNAKRRGFRIVAWSKKKCRFIKVLVRGLSLFSRISKQLKNLALWRFCCTEEGFYQ